MSEKAERIQKIREMVAAVGAGENEAVLSTVTPEGEPHATWMGTVTTPDYREIFTITSPDSQKVANIRANPRVEWMFTDAAKDAIVYMKGEAEEVSDVVKVKQAWDLLADKRRAYFLNYFNTGIGFTILCTQVKKVVYYAPKRNERIEIDAEELR